MLSTLLRRALLGNASSGYTKSSLLEFDQFQRLTALQLMATDAAVMMCVQGCAKLPGLAQFKLPHQPYNYLEKVSCSAAEQLPSEHTSF